MLFSPLFFTAQIVINEFSAKGGVISNEENEDWLEITNVSSSPINLSDYFLSDDSNDLEKWGMPDYSMSPGEILLILASGNSSYVNTGVWQSFVLAENDWSYFPASEEPSVDWKFLSFDDSSWDESSGGFGYADEDDGTPVEGFPSIYLRKIFQVTDVTAISEIILHADYDDAFVAYLNGTEIARSSNIEGLSPAFDTYATVDHEASLSQGLLPETYTLDNGDVQNLIVDGDNILAIQVHNVSNTSSDMSSSFYVTGFVDSFNPIYLPNPDWFLAGLNTSLFETNFKIGSGEQIIISDIDGLIIDSKIVPENLTTGLSFGRSPDGIGEWCFFDFPSPAESNGNSWCYNGIASNPIINLPSGWYTENEVLNGNALEGDLRYTTNGDIPTVESPIFSEVTLDENVSYSFRVFSELNYLPSIVLDRTYIFDEDNHSLPVFSIHTDEANLWDWDEGIYVYGPNADLENFPYFGSNFWEPWSKMSRLEFFNGAKELKAEEYLDLEIHGGWSRGENQKSFRFDFKSSYTGNLDEALFSQKPLIEDVNNINIRTGGQHLWTDKFQDGLFSRVVNDLHLDNMAYDPCLLYLNGEFWGVYGIREKMDEHYIESNHDINSNEVDLLNSWTALEGSDAHFIETYNTLMSANPNLSGYYETANGRLDLENYMDYFIAETYFQNYDWMGIGWGLNNTKLWRPQTDEGRWRYMMYDLDFGFSFLWGSAEDNFIDAARSPMNPNMHSELFDKLLENNQFKCEFAQRYADVVNTTFQPDVFSEKAGQIVGQLSGAMVEHTDRWAENVSVEDWLIEVEDIVDYNTTRIPFSRDHVNESLNLGGQFSISFDVVPEGAGSIQVNTIQPETYPWTGVYFNGCPVQIIANPTEGFLFDSWDSNGIISEGSEDPILLENLFQNDVFTANFSVDDGVSITEKVTQPTLEVFPNPTSGETTLNYTSSHIEDLQVTIYNTLGNVVYSEDFNKLNRETSIELDLSIYGKGMYIVELTSDSSSFSKRVAVQ